MNVTSNSLNTILRLAPQNLGEAVIITDVFTHVLFMNKAAERLTGYSLAETAGRKIGSTLGSFNDQFSALSKVRETAEGSVFRFRGYSLKTKCDKVISITGSISAIKNEMNEMIGFALIFFDVTEGGRYESHLNYKSMHDDLTGLYCRSVIFEYESTHQDEEQNARIGIVVCDIDGLKIINDTMGHKTGDQVIISIAKILKESFSEEAIVARIGGDEFAILVPNCTLNLLRNVYKQVKNKIANYNETNPELPLSVSLGYALSTDAKKEVQTLFQEADNNMYKEKLNHNRSIRSNIVSTIMRMVGAKDFITEGHCDRLKHLAELMGFFTDLPEDKINELRLLAEFHDIGKVSIPDKILLKPGHLTLKEKAEMERHCEIGHHIASLSPDLLPIANLILKHHEWWNGSGYPLGLKGENIPVECRILSIIDAYDAITNDRPYQKKQSKRTAVSELQKGAGTQFDPILVSEFIKLLASLKIYAASSLRDAMMKMRQVYGEKNASKDIIFRFDSSGTLKQHIENGGIADIFISASLTQMDELARKGLIIKPSRLDFLQNRIVLITSKHSTINGSFQDLALDKIHKIAIGDPEIVPAGKYGQEVLISLGLFEGVKSKLVFGKNVQQVLNYVENGAIDVGIVYQTEAIISENVRILDWAPAEASSPVVYSMAILKDAENKAESKRFIKFLTASPQARVIFENYGFGYSDQR